MKLRKALLFAAAGSLALAALVGIAALLGASSWWAERAVATTVAFAYFCISMLACAYVFEQRRSMRVFAIIGIVIALFALLYASLYWWVNNRFWDRFGLRHDRTEFLILMFYLGMFVAHVNLVWLPKRPRKLVRVFQCVATAGAVYCLLTMIDSLFNVTNIDDEFHTRFGGSVGILTGCATLFIPIWTRISALREKEESGFTRVRVNLQCPRCGGQQQVRVGGARCAQCGLRITVDVDEPRCQDCGYLLYGIRSGKCPECGTTVKLDQWWNPETNQRTSEGLSVPPETPPHAG